MPNQDEIMQQICKLVTSGAGAPLPGDAESALRDRYSNWIIQKKAGVSTSPMDIWDTEDGKGLQAKFESIGRTFAEKQAQKKDKIGAADCTEACREVETASACPHCPDPGI
jgi:hypothetical protein